MRMLPLVALTCVLACAPRMRSPSGAADAILPEATVWGEWRGALHESAPGAIAGTVTGTNDGATIPGAKIWILDAAGHVLAETASDATGGFRVDAPSRSRIVAASAPGWAFFVEEIEAVWTESPRIAMDPAVTVSGVVLGPDGAPLEGAEVWAFDMQRASHWPAAVSRIVRSGPRGQFTIRDAPDGLVGAAARYPKLEEGRSLIQQAAAGRALTGMDVGLERRVVLRGKVLAPDGKPAANVEVAFLSSREVRWSHPTTNAIGRTDEDGRFELRVSPITGWVVASTGTLDGASAVRIEGGAASASAAISLERFERCRGRVLDPSGVPLAGAAVERMHSWSSSEAPPSALAMAAFRAARQRGLTGARTDAEGRFDFPLFDPVEEGEEITVYVERADGEDGRSVTFAFGANPDIELELRRSLRGVVRDANGHTVRANGVVTATLDRADGRSTRTARIEGGAFELDGLEAGTWSLIATVDGRAAGPALAVTIGEERAEPVALIAGTPSTQTRVVRGRVLAKDGTPLAGVRISPGRRLSWENAVRSGPDGSFEVTVPEGVDSLFFYQPEFESAVESLGTNDGADLTITLVPGIASTQ